MAFRHVGYHDGDEELYRQELTELLEGSKRIMTAFEAIFFDLDGTLVDAGAAWRSAVADTVRYVCTEQPSTEPGELAAAYYDAARATWESVKIPAPPAWGSMEAESVVADVWLTALRRCGVTGNDLVSRVAAAYLACLQGHGAVPFADAAACLAELQPTYRLGLITNGNPAVQQAKLTRAGLARFFETVTTPDVGAGKPDRMIFRCAAESMGARLEAAAYVGDLLEWDVGGANNAGMASVWLNRKGLARRQQDPVPGATISSLAELPAAVRRMAARR